MSDSNEENQQLENNKENNQPEDNNLKIEDNLNINDIETNKIIEKEEHISESTKLKVDSNNQKEKGNNDFFHDKDITEDSIIYFTNKLKICNQNYKFILYISVIIYTVDIFFWFNSCEDLQTYFNIIALLMIFISSIHQAFSFRHNFENISKSLYIYTKRVVYVFIFIIVVYVINILYILINRIIDIESNYYFIKDKKLENIFIICYCLVNVFIPVFHLFRLISVKKGIKDLSSAKGEIYESGKIEDVEIINSVINEI